jgi:predicted nucleic acid-binding protein
MSDRPDLQFVDSNILVYAYDTEQGEKHEKAKALLLSLWKLGLGCVSIQVLQEFYVNLTRKSEFPLAPEKATNMIRDFSDWIIYRPGVNDIVSAVELHLRYRISFWDAMILQSARECNCTILWSEDLSSGQNYGGGVKVLNPFKQLPMQSSQMPKAS